MSNEYSIAQWQIAPPFKNMGGVKITLLLLCYFRKHIKLTEAVTDSRTIVQSR